MATNLAGLCVLLLAAPAAAQIDPQRVQDQQDMTWADYHPIPGVNWADPSLAPSKKQFKVALVAVDFPDQPFVITLPKRSDPFGNPQIDPVARERVPQFYADFYNTPSALNHGQTINGYWMEQSRGQVGIGKIDVFGPYRMPKRLFQYGLNEWGQAGGVPTGFAADGRLEQEADALWSADAGDIRKKYDIVLRIYAGYDETSVWQEFGEMKFQTKEDIPAEWGNPDPSKPPWVPTRYEPWTSWKAGQMQWGLSTVRQGESSGPSRTRSYTSPFAWGTTTTTRTGSRTGGWGRGRGTSWTAGRSTARAGRTGDLWCRRRRALPCRRASCCAAG